MIPQRSSIKDVKSMRDKAKYVTVPPRNMYVNPAQVPYAILDQCLL